jgi:hypothetical protein
MPIKPSEPKKRNFFFVPPPSAREEIVEPGATRFKIPHDAVVRVSTMDME